MANFVDDNFLLQSTIAEQLFHEYAKDLPIIDYHSHLPPDVIAKNENFENITKLWLAGDHYKWRAQRVLGVEERFITGSTSDLEKFRVWAACVPYTLRNPLYHWTHMELKNPFGIKELLNEANADEVYSATGEQLKGAAFTPKGFLNNFNVEMVGTTDDPLSSLTDHQVIAESSYNVKILPSFRPDKVFDIAKGDTYRAYISDLEQVSAIAIKDLGSLLAALQQRVDYFHAKGCRIADHGLSHMPTIKYSVSAIESVFLEVLEGNDNKASEFQEVFTGYVLNALCGMYAAKNWVQQFHLGALRNNNTRKLAELGADTGYDSIGDYAQAVNLSAFLNALEEKEVLAKTIIYNLNGSDNDIFAAMTGNFQSEGIRGKIQFGSGWWFMDQLHGMTDQMNSLSNIGLISCFVGMLTDSRSFLSYSRHEYFRRLLCNMFAEDIKNGLLPHDLEWTGKIIQDICYYNAKSYFEL
ncbi:glucuronate isomerase [Olivibacter sp. SDN3]|uniref:glucuronate isomerase n=1 Tax=Olivibacter sp. SDN3 TaxID=2764720 RepID=UPI001651B12F|nr:glucuronate isomerase [Olivibacter sp. SDN3]QNL50539.1 glucuronate isomerase [Olivibacter sp. SDN3]